MAHPPETVAKVLALYRSGATYKEIRAQTGVSPGTVRAWATDADEPPRQQARPQNPGRGHALTRYRNGDRVADIADDVGVHPDTVTHWAAEAAATGAERRPPQNRRVYDPDAIVAAYRSGKTLEQVADEFHAAKKTVERAVTAAGAARPTGRRPTKTPPAAAKPRRDKPRPLSPDSARAQARNAVDQSTAARYRAGASVADIAKQDGVHPTTVTARLRRARVTLRPRDPQPRTRTTTDHERILALHADGLTHDQIADAVGCGRRTVVRVLTGVNRSSRPGRPVNEAARDVVHALWDDGVPVGKIADQAHVAESTVYRWCHRRPRPT